MNSNHPRPTPGGALFRLAPLLAALLVLGSCSLGPRISRLFGGEISLDVNISRQLNGNAPVAVEVLILYDKTLLQQVLALDASAWFAQRDQFIKDHGSQKPGFDHWKWEWVPGQTIQKIPLDYRPGALGGVIFASYSSAGAHRQQVDPQLDILLELGAKGFTARQKG